MEIMLENSIVSPVSTSFMITEWLNFLLKNYSNTAVFFSAIRLANSKVVKLARLAPSIRVFVILKKLK